MREARRVHRIDENPPGRSPAGRQVAGWIHRSETQHPIFPPPKPRFNSRMKPSDSIHTRVASSLPVLSFSRLPLFRPFIAYLTVWNSAATVARSMIFTSPPPLTSPSSGGGSITCPSALPGFPRAPTEFTTLTSDKVNLNDFTTRASNVSFASGR